LVVVVVVVVVVVFPVSLLPISPAVTNRQFDRLLRIMACPRCEVPLMLSIFESTIFHKRDCIEWPLRNLTCTK
jgi:hypothetical protein